MSDLPPHVVAAVGQVFAAFGGASGLIFWRGGTLPTIAHTIGLLTQIKLCLPLSVRQTKLERLEKARLAFWCIFLLCFVANLLLLLQSGKVVNAVLRSVHWDHSIVEAAFDALLYYGNASIIFFLIASAVLTCEWGLDVASQYADLPSSIAAERTAQVAHLLELPETRYCNKVKVNDVMLLWQSRLVSIQRSFTSRQTSRLSCRWKDFSSTVCSYRNLIVSTNSDVLNGKQSK